MWPDVVAHKNSFFTFAYDAIAKGTLSGTPLTDAVRQVTDFPAPPRLRAVKNGGCADTAAEIGDRAVSFLTWHANPWSTLDTGSLKQTYPGHDFVLAYWMGRNQGLLADDTPTVCLHR